MPQSYKTPKVIDHHIRCHKCKHYIGFYRQYHSNICEWYALKPSNMVGRVKTPMDARRKIMDIHDSHSHKKVYF